ncbi:SDR family NAD(P)-dependent oxidoreductase [Desulfobacter sp.]|uniref:SDR family NAD(P)-dependent oxidoreductase n=1 Tax=Desulfobacter sp. TaxID=2294 RepID=UPI003D103CA1
MKILVTGGAGYIGSHTCVELLNQDHEVVVADNLVNSSTTALDRVKNITGKDLVFDQTDLLDEAVIHAVFNAHKDIEAVIHFAELKKENIYGVIYFGIQKDDQNRGDKF